MKKPVPITVERILAVAGALAAFGWPGVAAAQKPDIPPPYASIASNAIIYAGPGREASDDLRGDTIRIGILAPLHGPRRAEGDAMVAAAQLALGETSRKVLPRGRRVALALGDESVPPWGPLGNELIHLVLDDQVVALITPLSGETTHLSEQIGNRIGVPILSLSADATTTQIDLPWIFRFGPSDALEARLFAEEIYGHRGLRAVLLVTEHGHDGRVGGEEFQKAAKNLGMPMPSIWTVGPDQNDSDSLMAAMRSQPFQAVVFWTRSETARRLLARMRGVEAGVPVYLTQEAAREDFGPDEVPPGAETAGIWTVDSLTTAAAGQENFAQRYESATGRRPSPAAARTFDAVRLVVDALRATGPNRARVRDRLAAVAAFPGASGIISFDNEGNNRTAFGLVRLR